MLAERALEEADARDAAPSGEPLHGVPVAVKEEFDVAGTTFGGRLSFEPAERGSTVVRRLRAAGAVVIGKTNMPGPSSRNGAGCPSAHEPRAGGRWARLAR